MITEKTKHTILIVDDVVDNIILLQNALEDEHYPTLTAENGKEALEILETNTPDLILLDVSMPEMDGFQLCEILKNDQSTKDIPIIFLTARNQIEDIVKGLEIGAVDYLIKPVNYKELVVRVNTQIELIENRQALRNLNRELEKRVEERTAELNEANKKLSKLDTAKSDFLSLINHELRTPLNGIFGFAQIIYDVATQNEVKDFIKEIFKSANRLLELSEFAVLIASLRANNYKLDNANILVMHLVSSLIEVEQQRLDNKRIKIVKNLQPQDVALYSDHKLVYNCLKIILDNSIRFSPLDSTIYINSTLEDEQIKIEFIDEGEGFSDEALNHLFELLSTTNISHHSEGFGLGLATAKLIMEANSGEIKIANATEKGASISLYFPKN